MARMSKFAANYWQKANINKFFEAKFLKNRVRILLLLQLHKKYRGTPPLEKSRELFLIRGSAAKFKAISGNVDCRSIHTAYVPLPFVYTPKLGLVIIILISHLSVRACVREYEREVTGSHLTRAKRFSFSASLD